MAQERLPEIHVRGFVFLTAALPVLIVIVALGQVSAAAVGLGFEPAVLYGSGGYGTQDLALADLNGDGKLDIVVSSWWGPGRSPGPGVVGVLLGNGDGTFQPVVTYETGGAQNGAVVVADVNGDGKPDILVVSCAPTEGSCATPQVTCEPSEESCTIANGVLSVLLGNGDGTFQSARTFETGAPSAVGLAVFDLNGDGKLDAIVTNSSASNGTVAVLLGDGKGNFGSPVLYDSGGPGASGVAVADVNGDSVPDLLVVNSGNLGVLLGNRDGTFQPAVIYPTGGQDSGSLVVRDVNGDGYPDVIVGNVNLYQPHGTVSVLLGVGNGTFAPPVVYDSGGYAADNVAVADVNGDGKLDIVVANCGPVGGCGPSLPGEIGVLLGNGDGTFQQAVPFSTRALAANAVVVGDVNGDGLQDLVTANLGESPQDYTSPTGSISVLLAARVQTTTMLTSSLNPSTYGQAVTFRATVSSKAGTPSDGEIITFRHGATVLGAVPLKEGTASLTVSSLPRRSADNITASYPGDRTFAPSISATLLQVVDSSPTATTLTSSLNPSDYGQAVTFTAAITAPYSAMIPNGETVTFYNGSALIGTSTTTGGVASFTTSVLAAKTHTIRATYSGDRSFKKSDGTLTQVVNRYATTTTLVSSLNPSSYGEPVTWTVRVTSTGPNLPTGHVKIVGLGDATLKGGVATLTRTWLDAATYATYAEYEGDDASAPSTSATLNQVIRAASTTTVITSSANPAKQGQTVTFTATIKSSTGASPVGTVTFTAGATMLGTVTIGNSPTSVSTNSLPVGTTTVRATYNGVTDFSGSSALLTETINP